MKVELNKQMGFYNPNKEGVCCTTSVAKSIIEDAMIVAFMWSGDLNHSMKDYIELHDDWYAKWIWSKEDQLKEEERMATRLLDGWAFEYVLDGRGWVWYEND